jgi:hypothetical protein
MMKRLALATLRILLSGLAAAAAWWAGILLAFGPLQVILADPERQSAKFLAAFTQPPLPRMAERPEVLAYGLLIVGLVHAGVYAWMRPRLAGGMVRRGCAFGLIACALMVPWFEFYLPWNVMREPLLLVLLECLCWLVVLQVVGLAVAGVHHLFGLTRPYRSPGISDSR